MGLFDKLFEPKELKEQRKLTDEMSERTEKKCAEMRELLRNLNKECVDNSNYDVKMRAIGKNIDPSHKAARDAGTRFVKEVNHNMNEASQTISRFGYPQSVEDHKQRRHHLDILESNLDGAMVEGRTHVQRVHVFNNLVALQYSNLTNTPPPEHLRKTPGQEE